MKYFSYRCACLLAFLFKTVNAQVQPRIAGGQQAQPGEFPYFGTTFYLVADLRNSLFPRSSLCCGCCLLILFFVVVVVFQSGWEDAGAP
jgi:hypothetical protein